MQNKLVEIVYVRKKNYLCNSNKNLPNITTERL